MEKFIEVICGEMLNEVLDRLVDPISYFCDKLERKYA